MTLSNRYDITYIEVDTFHHPPTVPLPYLSRRELPKNDISFFSVPALVPVTAKSRHIQQSRRHSPIFIVIRKESRSPSLKICFQNFIHLQPIHQSSFVLTGRLQNSPPNRSHQSRIVLTAAVQHHEASSSSLVSTPGSSGSHQNK